MITIKHILEYAQLEPSTLWVSNKEKTLRTVMALPKVCDETSELLAKVFNVELKKDQELRVGFPREVLKPPVISVPLVKITWQPDTSFDDEEGRAVEALEIVKSISLYWTMAVYGLDAAITSLHMPELGRHMDQVITQELQQLEFEETNELLEIMEDAESGTINWN